MPSASNNDNIVIEQLLPEGGNCIQIMNPDGAPADINGYPTIYVNMNDLQFLDASNLNLNNTNEPQLKLQVKYITVHIYIFINFYISFYFQNANASLINQQENMQVNDIIFNIDPLKPGLSLPPDEIFETSPNQSSENEVSDVLPSIAEIPTKPIKLNGFSEDNLGDKSGNLTSLLNNSMNLYTNVSLNNYLNLPITIGEGGTVFDSTASNALFQPADVADLNHADDIYETTNIICISCSKMFTSLDTFQAHTCNSLTEGSVDVGNDGKQSKDQSSNCDNKVEDDSPDEGQNATFKCEVCSKLFSHKASLDRHLGTHSVKSNIVCGICKTVVSGRSQYIKHLAAHKGPKGSLLRSCKFCFKEFKKPSDLVSYFS